MTDRTAPSSDGLRSQGSPEFSSALRQMPEDLCTVPGIIPLSPLSLATDVTDATLGASVLWLGILTRAVGTATLAKSIFGGSPNLRGRFPDE